MKEVKFDDLKKWQKIISVLFMIFNTFASFYITNFYFNGWPKLIYCFSFMMIWVVFTMPIVLLFDYLNKIKKTK